MNEEGEYDEPINPVRVEQVLYQISQRIAKGVRICDQRLAALNRADEAYRSAYAHAYLNANGPQAEKRYRAEIATEAEYQAKNVAEQAYKYAERTAKALEKELDAYRSIGVSTRTLYGMAGQTGEGV